MLGKLQHGDLTHDQIRGAFTKVVNLVEPEHPYLNNVYPLNPHNVEYGYKKNTSSTYASCGPSRSSRQPIIFKADRKFFNNCSPERVLAILTHELTHVTVGSHSNQEHGAHPPRFWREFGFNAHIVLENWDTIEETFGEINKTKYIGEIISSEVTKYNIDRRYGNEQVRKHEMARWFESTLK